MREAAEVAALDVRAATRSIETAIREQTEAIKQVQARPGSNIPAGCQQFRTELADELGIADDEVPYLAELVEIQPTEAARRGVVERAIGADRLRIMVPTQHLRAAVRWINGRRNRLHVRLQEARSADRRPKPFADGFFGKLNFKDYLLATTA